MKNYRLLILSMLKEAGRFKLPEDALRAQLARQIDGEVNEVHFQQDLKWLMDKAWVDYTVESISEVKRWQITEEGKKQ